VEEEEKVIVVENEEWGSVGMTYESFFLSSQSN
jgi:hypothetical protein